MFKFPAFRIKIEDVQLMRNNNIKVWTRMIANCLVCRVLNLWISGSFTCKSLDKQFLFQDDYNPVTNDEKNRNDSDSTPNDGREQWGM